MLLLQVWTERRRRKARANAYERMSDREIGEWREAVESALNECAELQRQLTATHDALAASGPVDPRRRPFVKMARSLDAPTRELTAPP